MRLDTLEKRMQYYRSLTDYRLMPKTPVIIFLDGRAFSKFCKIFEKPFDDIFIHNMNETAKYLCKNIEGCKFAYVQSDEITLYVSDTVNNETESWFGYRLTKMLSIAASLATAKFNQLLTIELCKSPCSREDLTELIANQNLVEFDCKAWNVPTENEVYNYFLWRQIDCIRNSKQMAAQAYIPHKELEGLHTGQQIEKLEKEKGIKWGKYSDDKKFGRFIYKELVKIPYEIPDKFKNGNIPNNMMESLILEDDGYYIQRNKWITHNGFELTTEDGKNNFYNILGWQQ